MRNQRSSNVVQVPFLRMRNVITSIYTFLFTFLQVTRGVRNPKLQNARMYEKQKKSLSMTRDWLTPCLKSLSKCRRRELRSRDHLFSSILLNHAMTVT